jgi:hypothetical protein
MGPHKVFNTESLILSLSASFCYNKPCCGCANKLIEKCIALTRITSNDSERETRNMQKFFFFCRKQPVQAPKPFFQQLSRHIANSWDAQCNYQLPQWFLLTNLHKCVVFLFKNLPEGEIYISNKCVQTLNGAHLNCLHQHLIHLQNLNKNTKRG